MKASVTLIPTLLVKQGRDDSTLSSLLATYDSGIPGMYMYAKYTHKQNDSTFTLASPSSTPKCYTLLRAELDLEVFVPAGMRAFSWPSNRYVPSEGESCSMCTSVCLCFVFVFFFFTFARFFPAPVDRFLRSWLRGTQGSRAGFLARALGVQSREIWQLIAGSLSAELESNKTTETPHFLAIFRSQLSGAAACGDDLTGLAHP